MADNAAHPPSLVALLTRCFLAFGAVTAVTLIALAAELGDDAVTAVGIAALVIVGAGTALALVLYLLAARPLDRLALDVGIIARDNPNHALRIGSRHRIGRLAAGIEQMRQRLLAAETETEGVLAEATARVDQQKRQLEAILLDLSEGVIVCNLQHQVLLYNPAAAAFIDPPATLGLGRSLFAALTQAPVQHALDRLLTRPGGESQKTGDRFICGTVEGQRLLRARLALVLGSNRQPSGYVLTLRDISGSLAAMARRDDLLLSATEGLRAPVANLRAAAEMLAGFPDLPPDQRHAFDQVVLKESAALSERIETLARGYRELGGGQWLMTEIHTTDLIASLTRRLADLGAVRLTATGLPNWVYGDSLSLLVLLDHVVRWLHQSTGATAFDIAVSPADRRVNIDLVWSGNPIAAAELETWLDRPLIGGLGPLTGRTVLQRHGSDLWSQADRFGTALLRLPLPSAEPVATAAPLRPPIPARPEFYDFDLLHRPLATGRFAERPLRQLTYVVFDLETTGLRPSAGDAVVSIAAVRVVNGRILTMETFERLVNPQRSIPPESTAFHGITEAMVQDKPPLAVVLPQFQRFAVDAVLVAHNAAFDLAFLERNAGESGVRFDNPVLDTLLLSAFLDAAEEDHSLDAVAMRYGFTISGRHTAAGDALVTAAILVRQLERLEERGLTRLGEVIAATDMAAKVRVGQAHF